MAFDYRAYFAGREMYLRVSGFCQPAEELRSLTFTDDHFLIKRNIQVKRQFSGEETGHVDNSLTANQELAVCPEKVVPT